MTTNPWTGLRPAAVGLLLFAAVPAQNLTSDQVLRIHFTVPSSYTPRPPDVLRLNFGLIQVHSAFTARNASIYHCDQLLGTASSPSFGSHVGALNLDPSNSWKSPSSLWNFDSPGTIDFTRIVNGTLTGIIEFTITTGAVTIPLNQINLNFVAATSANGGTVVTPAPTITHRIVSPKLRGPTPGLINVQNTWTITGLTANQPAFFAFGTQCMPFPVLGDMFDIANPSVFVAMPTNANGVSTLTLFVPGSVAGGRIMVQGIQIAGSNLQFTNLSAHTF
jgi:hypothetical protein